MAHICRMETTVAWALIILMATSTAIAAALTLAYVAHYGFGFSRDEIRTPAVVGAAVIAVLVAAELFGKKLRKPN
jgi:hypothetical protein